MDDRAFILLFFPSFFISLAIFFIGVAAVWWVSIQNREMKKKGQ